MLSKDVLDIEAITEIAEAIQFEGYTPQDFTKVTDEEMEAAYAVAYNLLNQAQFKQAEKLFEFLCYMNPYEGRFWIGLGAVRQQQKKFETALNAYVMAGVHDMGNPVPPLRAAECYIALGLIDEARLGISSALHWCGDKAEYKAFKARAQVLLEGIERQDSTRKEG